MLNMNLIEAIRGADFKAFVEILNGPDVDINEAIPLTGETPLLAAVRSLDQRFIMPLLARGANVNKADSYGMTPLHAFIYAFILSKNMDIDPTLNCENPKISRCSDMIRFLSMEGADFNKKNQDGATPLHTAIMLNSAEAVQSLLWLGSDPKLVGPELLCIPVSCGNLQMVNILIGVGICPKDVIGTQEELDKSGRVILVRRPQRPSFKPDGLLCWIKSFFRRFLRGVGR